MQVCFVLTSHWVPLGLLLSNHTAAVPSQGSLGGSTNHPPQLQMAMWQRDPVHALLVLLF